MSTQLSIFRPEQSERRSFVRRENNHLGAFLDADDLLLGWWRSYRCECGFRCTSPGDIWDHSLTCAPPTVAPTTKGDDREDH